MIEARKYADRVRQPLEGKEALEKDEVQKAIDIAYTEGVIMGMSLASICQDLNGNIKDHQRIQYNYLQKLIKE